jgi:hypothetical protein
LHQPDITFGYEIADRQAISGKTACYPHNKSQMTADEFVKCGAIAAIAPSDRDLLLTFEGEDRIAVGDLDEAGESWIEFGFHRDTPSLLEEVRDRRLCAIDAVLDATMAPEIEGAIY